MKNLLYLILILLFQSCKDNNSDLNDKSIENNNISDDNTEQKYIEKDEKGNILIEGILINKKKHGVWKYYNKGNLTDIKRFYKDSLMYVLDEKDYMYKEVFLEKINSYIPIPKYWETDINFDDDNTVLTTVKKCNDSVVYCPNIVLKYENILASNFDDFVVEYKNEIQSNFDNLIVKGFSKNNLAKTDSYIFKYYINYNNTDIAFMTMWFKDKQNVIVYTASCEKKEIEKNLHLFLQIGNSITKKK